MSFLHCHNPECSFSQDDFWSDSYNPIKFMQNWLKDLLGDDFFEDCRLDKNWREEHGYERDDIVTTQELIAHEFEKHAYIIRQMKYRTFEEFKTKNPEWVCPMCGKKELDID